MRFKIEFWLPGQPSKTIYRKYSDDAGYTLKCLRRDGYGFKIWVMEWEECKVDSAIYKLLMR